MRRHIGPILVLTTLVGCKTATGVKPMAVHVRDQATQEPVEGATVSASVAHLFVPYEKSLTDIAAWFDKNPRVRTIATTDAEGIAKFDAVQDCPVKIVIARAGYEPLEAFIGACPSAASSGDWIEPNRKAGESDASRLEARFVPIDH